MASVFGMGARGAQHKKSRRVERMKRFWRVSIITLAILAASLLVLACAEPAAEPAPAAPPAQPTPAAPAAQPTPAAPAAPATTPEALGERATPAPAAPATTYPQRAITVIVPWNAGGSTDIGARVLAVPMERILGAPQTIVNRGGAGSQIGVTELANASPDGYTIGWTNLPSSMSPYLDPARGADYGRDDLVQVANVIADPEVFVVRTESQYQTFEDMLEDARARPGEVSVSFTGIGSDNHLALLMFEELADVEFNKVNFDGGAPAMTALLGGHVDVNFQTVGNYPTHVAAGSVRFLAVADEERLPFTQISDVPTLRELGYDLVFASSRGISVPRGTPQEVVDILADAVREAMEDPQVQQTFADALLTTRFMGPDEYTQYWDEFEETVAPLIEEHVIQ
jgi:tripartite-type tricarboxylate transporter receptor subunit TctC